MDNVIRFFTEASPFAILALLVLVVQQNRAQAGRDDEKLKLGLVDLLSSTVKNVRENTDALRALRDSIEAQHGMLTAKVDAMQHQARAQHSESLRRFDALQNRIDAVPEQTDKRLAPRFIELKQLLERAIEVLDNMAADVRKLQVAQVVQLANPTGGKQPNSTGQKKQEDKKDGRTSA